jgi:type II secretory pathway component PulF
MTSADQEHFLNDLRAAVIAGVPIDVGTDSFYWSEKLLTLRQLEKQFPSASSDRTLNDSTLPDRLKTAVRVFEVTRDMPLVLQGLSEAPLAARKAVHLLRWTIVYLVIVLLVAWLGMIFFSVYLVPEIETMRADILLSRRPDLSEPGQYLPWIGKLIYVFGAVLTLALISMAIGGVRRFVMLVGGRHYVRCRVESLADVVTARLLNEGLDADESQQLAIKLTGAARKRPEQNTVVSSEAFAGRFALPLGVIQSGERRLEQIRATVPNILLVIIGGFIALAYGAAVFTPIIELLRDLAMSGV